MSVYEERDYLYLIWKDNNTRRQYIVGQLSKNGHYEFKYSGEVEQAIKAGFTPLVSFQDIKSVYCSDELFPVFASRLPDRKRKDIGKILEKYCLEEYDAYKLLKMSGAKLPIDTLQFIDPILDFENEFERVFYMAGVRHYLGCNGEECKNSIEVTRGDEVFLEKEPENQYDSNAIKIVNSEGMLLGYLPRYYSQAFTRLINEKRNVSCHVCDVEKEKCCSECIKLVVKVR